MLNAHMCYCTKMMEYLTEKREKARMHSVFVMGTTKLWFEVLLRNRNGLGMTSGVITHEVSLGQEGNNNF